LDLKAKKIVHGRSSKSDINDARVLGVDWIGIFYGTSPSSRKYKFNVNKTQCLSQIENAIKYAKDQGLKLRFTAEDASRTEESFLIEVATLAQKSGADRFSFADTVGCLTPSKSKRIISKIAYEIDIPVHVHFHNDFGMGTANSLSALEGGAQCVDLTINGLGERCGIAPLAEVITALVSIYNKKENYWNLELIPVLTDLVNKICNFNSRFNQPIIGKNAFTHKAGIHSKGILKNPLTYEAFSPQIVKRDRKILINKFSGVSALKSKLKNINLELTKEELGLAIAKIKSFKTKNDWSKEELYLLVENIKES